MMDNKDLEEAYELGYKAAVANSFWKGCTDEDEAIHVFNVCFDYYFEV